MIKIKKERMYDLGLIIILFIFLNVFITSAFFIFKISISVHNFILSLALTCISYAVLMQKRKYEFKAMIIYPLIFILLVVSSTFLGGLMYDGSYDGNSYHKVAVGELKNGWNPLYESIADFDKKIDFQIGNTYELWNDHYGKAYWFYAANTYKVTDNIESGKSMLMLTVIATFLIVYALLKSFKGNFLSLILSLLVALNPVMIYQLSTYYNDGLLGNFLIIMLVSLTFMVKPVEGIPKKENYLLYFLILCLLINVKFTGFVYAGIYSLLYYIYIIINKKERKENLKFLTITAILSLIVGVGVLGSSTYPKNFIDHGHPFYPLFGEEKVDIMTSNSPKAFLHMNRFERFLVSNFSKTQNAQHSKKGYSLKIPFTFTEKELYYFTRFDARTGGYGVLFGGILIVTTVIFVYSLIKTRKKEYGYLILYLLPILGNLLLIIILEESWWARYLPQLYLYPVITILLLSRVLENKHSRIITYFLVITLVMNSILILKPSIEGVVKRTKKINEQFETIDNSKTLYIYDEVFSGAYYNVADKFENVVISSACCNCDFKYIMEKKVKINEGCDEFEIPKTD